MFQITAKKSLGQHFLVDPKIHTRIADALAIHANDVVIEIGPGTGLLTRELLASPLKKLLAFELDSRAVPELRNEFQHEGARFSVMEQDFLETNLIAISGSEGQKLCVAGNIPYYITSPILFKLIDECSAVSNAILLVQKEVAERLVAKPRTKEYGIPTVLANFFGEVTYLFTVRAGAFRPVPKVDSALVRINFERDYFSRSGSVKPEGFDENTFRALVRSLFAMRRKTIRNNIKATQPPFVLERLEASPVSSFLKARAEELTVPDFLVLHAAIKESIIESG